MNARLISGALFGLVLSSAFAAAQVSLEQERPAPVPQPVLAVPLGVTTSTTIQVQLIVGSPATGLELHAPTGTQEQPHIGGISIFTVDLLPNMENVLVAYGKAGERASVPLEIRVRHDDRPPVVSVVSPADGSLAYRPSVDLSGDVLDPNGLFAGGIVLVNDDPAIVRGSTWFYDNAPLAAVGTPTSFIVEAIDAAGNQAQTSIQVTQATPNGSRLVLPLGEDDVGGLPGSVVPLQVRAQDESGAPIPGLLIDFALDAGEGELAEAPGGGGDDLAQVVTDAQGEATAWWSLDGEAGAGNQRVRISATDLEDVFVFHASVDPDPADPAVIEPTRGVHMVGEPWQPASDQLVVTLYDGTGNTIPDGTVTFTAKGGGRVNGEATAFVQTDATGRASASYSFGRPGKQTVGVSSSSLAVDELFVMEARPRRPDGATWIRRWITDPAGRALEGVEVTAHHPSGVQLGPVASDAEGAAALNTQGLWGRWTLRIDGVTATHADGRPLVQEEYGSTHVAVTLAQGVGETTNEVCTTLPARETVTREYTATGTYDGSVDVALQIPGFPGYQAYVSASSASWSDGRPIDPQNPVGLWFAVESYARYGSSCSPTGFALGPPGLCFDPPAQVSLPNADGDGRGRRPRWDFIGVDLDSSGLPRLTELTAPWTTSQDARDLLAPIGVQQAREGARTMQCANRMSQLRIAMDNLDVQGFFGELMETIAREEKATSLAVVGPSELAAYQTDATAAWFHLKQAMESSPMPGTLPIPSRAGIAAVTARLYRALVRRVERAGGIPFSTPDVQVVVDLEEWTSVDAQADGDFVSWEATLQVSPTSRYIQPGVSMVIGDRALRRTLVGESVRAQALATMQVTQVLGQTLTVSGYLFLPRSDVRATAVVGSRKLTGVLGAEIFLSLIPTEAGRFVKPYVTAHVANGVWSHRQVLTIDTPVALRSGGATTITGLVAADDPSSLVATEVVPTEVFIDASQAQQLNATATLEDGSQADVTLGSMGTWWTASATDDFATDSDGLLAGIGSGSGWVRMNHFGFPHAIPVRAFDPLQETSLQGLVVKESDGQPIQARLTISPFGSTAVTLGDGTFSRQEILGDPAPDTVEVVAYALTANGPLVGSKNASTKPNHITDFGEIRVGAAVVWISDQDGDWENGANWSTGAPPGPADLVYIDREGVDVQVYVNSHVEVRNIINAETLNVLGGGKLTVIQEIVLFDELRLAGGELVGADLRPGSPDGMLRVAANSVVRGLATEVDVLVENGVFLTVRDSMRLDGDLKLDAQGASTRVLFSGGQFVTGSGRIELGRPNAWVIPTGGIVHFEVDIFGQGRFGGTNSSYRLLGTTTVAPSASLEFLGVGWSNQKLMKAENGATLRLDGTTWINEGTVETKGGSTLAVDGTFENQSCFVVTDSTLVGAGDFDRNDLGNVDFSGASNYVISGHLDNTGDEFSLQEWGGSVTIDGGRITGGTIDTGQLQFVGVSSLDSVELGSDLVTTVQSAASLTVTGGMEHDGMLQLDASGNSSSLFFPGTQTLDGTGTVAFVGTGSLHKLNATQGGTLTIGPGIHVAARAGTIGTAGTGVVMRGRLDADGPGTTFLEGTGFTNEGGTVETSASGGIWSNAPYTQLSGSTIVGDGSELRGTQGLAFDGGAIISDGQIVGDVTNAGGFVLRFGANPVPLAGNYTQTTTGTLFAELGGTTAGADYSQLDVTGDTSLGGGLDVQFSAGYVPGLGDRFDVILFSGFNSGSFDFLNLPSPGPGLDLNLYIDLSSVYLLVETSQ